MQLALIGATGLVGQTVLRVLEERHFPVQKLLPVASASAAGRPLTWVGKPYTLLSLEAALAARPTLAIFAAGAEVSQAWAPRFAASGTTVIDNSTAWRMHPAYPLIVPEVNGHQLCVQDKLIANPNCSTIQLVMALAPLHQRYGLRRLMINTYQAVTGSGQAAVNQLMAERQGHTPAVRTYPHAIDLNVLPHIDDFAEDGSTKEERKLVNETQKILGDNTIRVTATAVRVPVMGGHSLAVNAELGHDFDLHEVVQLLSQAPGVVVQNDFAQHQYPMPIHAQHKDEVFVGRIRRDHSQPNTLHMWIVADNLRKGAATNAVQIAEQVSKLID
ncbi:MAG: aspartate-semialdehyde dehydrogenase [Roseivirga sp.]